jgi:hypothetical protein
MSQGPPETVVYVGCLNVQHRAVDCPSSGQPMESWCETCATRSHLIDDHMACHGAASAMVAKIVGVDVDTLAHMHTVAHDQRRRDGRPDHEHARNVWLPSA